MIAYINTRTGDFPLFYEDVVLYDLNWKSGDPLPEYFEEVEIDSVPQVTDDETFESTPPFKVNNKWVQKHFIRKLTEDEIALSNLRKQAELERIKNSGILVPTQTAVLDENGNMVIDPYGNSVEAIIE